MLATIYEIFAMTVVESLLGMIVGPVVLWVEALLNSLFFQNQLM